MKTKRIAAIIALTITALIVGACNKGTTSSNANSDANSSSANSGTGSSPAVAFKTLYEATQKKDVENIKKGLSARTLAMLADIARKQNRTLDETLKENLSDPDYNSATVPETQNEKINGDEATLEVKAPKTGKWTELPFVKEDGRWKLAYDKLNQGDIATTETEPAPQPAGNKKAKK
jgi:hypothetical protein